MYKIQEDLKEYIQCLNLPGNKDKVILEGLNLLKELNTDEISQNSNLIAILFCTVICNCTEEMISEAFISELV